MSFIFHLFRKNGHAPAEIHRTSRDGAVNLPLPASVTPAPKKRALIRSSFRLKVLVPVVSCLALAVAATFFVVQRELARQFDKDARRTLLAANEVVRYS